MDTKRLEVFLKGVSNKTLLQTDKSVKIYRKALNAWHSTLKGRKYVHKN